MRDHPSSGSGSHDELEALRARVRELEAQCALLAEGGQPSLKPLLENSPDIITVIDRELRLLYLNRSLSWRRVGDMLHKSVLDFMSESDRPAYVRAFERVWASGEVQQVEVESVGALTWEARLVPLRSAGEIVAVMGIGADITQRKRLEEQIRQAQKLEALGRVTAGIAHNFNNMLTVILSNLRLIQATSSDTVRSRLSDAEHAAQRAADMVRELMVFARRRRKAAELQAIDLQRVVARAIELGRAGLDAGTELRFDVDGELEPVLGDEGQVEQALLNILTNARDALREREDAPEPPRIHVQLDRSQLPSAAPGEGRPALRLRISDNGSGMSESERGHVFEPFFTTKAVHHGTGLGLATAYGTMIDLGGAIWCDSAPGAGATFTLLFPIKDTA